MSDHCQDLVAKADKDRFLSCLFAPQDARPHLFALYAFNVEIARIREAVSEPQVGLVRQQWWLDTIDGIYAGRTPDHPVAQALVAAIAKGDLPKHALQNLVIAREFDLFDDPMPSLADLEGYLGETSSSLIQMAALILGKGAAEAAGLAGVAFGLAGVLRLQKTRYLPTRHGAKSWREGNHHAIMRPCPQAPERSASLAGDHSGLRHAGLPAGQPHQTLFVPNRTRWHA